MATYRISRVYVVKAATKAGARQTLVEALTTAQGDPDELLDFESIREMAPEEERPSTAQQFLHEAKRQLLGRTESTHQPALKNGQS